MAEGQQSSYSSCSSQTHKYTNRLASEHSPYLLQHAHNPKAFAEAHRRDVPIFLSSWCHVMEVESFENEEVAKLLNDWFVSIKVDREERPDVDKNALKMVLFTLQCMGRGGIHDQVGGGFHRYSLDECWHVPYFEKMLYDQGQLVNVYLDAFCMTKNVFYSSLSRDRLDYLRRDMIGPSGEIFSAEDADSYESEGASWKKEGAFYVWTSTEDHYYIKPSGNCDLSSRSDPHNEFRDKNVLKEVIVSWNGLVISSLARASKILKGEPEETKFYFPVTGTNPKEYMDVAEKAASFIRKHLYNEQTHRLQHSFRNDPSKDELFLDKARGGYFSSTGEDPYVLLRVKEDHDGAEPSGNSASVINLVRLASMVAGDKSKLYTETAEHVLKRLKDAAVAVPLMCCAADILAFPSRKQVVLVGVKSFEEFENMVAAARASYGPNKTVIHIDPIDVEEVGFWEETNGNIVLMAKNNAAADRVIALVCETSRVVLQ
ncbi:unnamed protein product [Withania somnifera]